MNIKETGNETATENRYHDLHRGDDIDSQEEQEIVINANYEVFVAGFLVIQIVNSAMLVVPLGPEQRQIVFGFWIGISAFLLIDATIRTIRAWRNGYALFSHMRWTLWLGAAPVPFFSTIRLVAAALLVRRLKSGSYRAMGRVIIARHAQTTLLLIIFVSVIFFEFGSFLILATEHYSADANINTAEDAIWWSLVTISTVGYGDKYPTSSWGRFIGSILIITGVGIFTSVTSFMARWFMRPRAQTREEHQHTKRQADPIDNIHEIRDMLTDLEDTHQSAIQELEERLKRLEQQITEDSSMENKAVDQRSVADASSH